MLISSWLTSVRNCFQSPRVTKRRISQKQASQAAENLEQRALLTSLQAVRPNIGEFLTPGEIRTIAPQELTLQFDLGSSIDPASISSSSIQVQRSGFDGIFGNGNDALVTIGYVGVGSASNEVVLRFGETLVDENYRIFINGSGPSALTADGGTAVIGSTFNFELDLGAKILAVDPQPVTRLPNGTLSQARDKIVLYFNEDDLKPSSAQNVNFYQLIFTSETVSSLDDVVHAPTSAVYDATANTVTLTFASDIASLSGAGSYRLRVGNAESLPLAPATLAPGADPGSSFAAATVLPTPSTAVNSSVVISSAVNAQFMAFSLPGAGDEPGHRNIEVENHLMGGADGGASGIPYIDYNFKDVYGSDPGGNDLHNLINEDQRNRAREIFQFYSELAGIDFRETASSGLTIVTGDLRALDKDIPTGVGGVAGLAKDGTAIMDMAEVWDSAAGGNWFSVAMHEIGHLLGQGHTYDLPALTVQGSGSSGSVGTNTEPDYPGDHDIVHIQHMFRPDSIDIDLYRFQVNASSLFSAEVMAERLANSSRLDSVLRLYKEVGGQRELISQNDNYFSKDSFLEVTLEPGVYYVGVSSTGNDAYDPTIANTGFGGTSQGAYDLRVNFRPNVSGLASTIIDTTDRTFDGDSDGLEGGVYNFWFKTASAANTLFIDKSTVSFLSSPVTLPTTSIVVRQVAPFAVNDVIRIDNEQMRITAINVGTRTLTVTRAFNATVAAAHSLNAPIRKMSATGQIGAPFGFVGDALSVAQPGQIVRIAGNGGADSNIATINDNLPYEIGLNTSNQALADGSSLEVPRGVTLMIDAGAVVKLRRGWLGAGSSTTSVDRSGNALQVLGVPGRQVIFTSWNDETIGTDTTSTPTTAQNGDWGGIIFRNEIDRAQNRFNPENEGIFLNYVSNADIRWGGGSVTIDTATQTINPIHMERSQPTIVNNLIQFSNDSGMSADPDSFEELTFHSPRFQTGKPAFTVDYKRIGPDIRGNTLLKNGNNALFVRIDTVAGGATQSMTVPGRFNDADIVHLVSQNLVLQGTPGGAYQDNIAPSVTLVTLTTQAGGTLAAGTYNYRIVFTDENGFESPASAPTANRVLAVAGSIRLAQLPPATGVYTGRRIYRSQNTGAAPYSLVAELDSSATTFTDTGVTLARTLTAFVTRDRARLDARLAIDPGIVVKLQGARIQADFGAQLIAEGAPGRQVIFTSRLDDRYGAGGTFDTNNDDTAAVETTPSAGNWGGFYIGHFSSASIDRALITFGGGSIPVGSGFSNFNPVEIHQAKARIRHSVFETNADGTGTSNRSGLFPNAAGTIFVRAAQPVLLDNTFVGNIGAVVNINVNALNKDIVTDYGRSTGLADRTLSYADNQGPLIRDSIMDGNTRNGMIVRGETLTTQVIWDDTDLVHILLDEIYVPNLHTYGGLRLESSTTESLVVKLSGTNAGFTAGGSTLDLTDRIGGMLHIVGQPGQPVILTSLSDDTVGAGFDLEGLLQKDTNGNGASTGLGGDWRGVNIDQYSHDRNVAVYVEHEIADRLSADTNLNADSAEVIGSLAEKQAWGDENLRLGIDLQGFIDSPGDIDVYSFSGVAGSQIWIDIDRSTYALDSVVELLDTDGNILAQSDNYYDEKLQTWQVVTQAGGNVEAFGLDYSQYLSDDHYTINPRDAGLRVILPGTVGVRGKFFVRVRSSNIDPTTAAPRTDLQDTSKIANGLTTGVYQMQIRLQEKDEYAGTTVQYADIRFAQNGIKITGQPVHSPLAGESEEVDPNDNSGQGLQLGNLLDSDRAVLAVRGTIGSDADVDFYKFEVNYTHTQQITGVSLTAPHVPVVFDLDYADGVARADMTLAIYDSAGKLILIGRDSNVADDQAGPVELNGDTDDLSRGSVGTFDPYVGTVELPGGDYFLSVFNNTRLPAVLDQFTRSASANNLLRLEPVNFVRRIAEERFSADDADTFTSADAPPVNLFGVASGRSVNGVERGIIDPSNVVPYHLGDVVLFVSINGGSGGNESTIGTINPFTGEIVTVLGDFGPSVGDIAMRPDGQLYAFSTGPQGTGQSTSGVTGNYLRINTGTGAVTNVGDDGLITNRDNLDGNGLLTPADNAVTDANAGMIYSGMTFTGTGDKNLFAVGARANVNPPANSTLVAQYTTNVLYRFDIRTGVVDSVPSDRSNDARAYNGAGTTQREIGQMNAFGTVTGLASIGGQMFAVDSLGFLYRVNTANAATTLITNLGTSFTSLVAGPDEVEGGKYANMLFAMTVLGDLMAFDTTGTLQPVFYDGQDTLNVGVPGSTGLAFSTLDRNLWQTTSVRGSDLGHGVETRFDDSVLTAREPGGISLYFGNQRSGAAAGNQNNLSDTETNNYDFPGGAHGSVLSNEFSLEGYRNTDKPVLYFNYLLQTENNDVQNVAQLMRDSFRVFVGDESGQWTEVTTNNSFRGPGMADDEFDYGSQVEETFDTTQWRQARVDLSSFAGLSNLRLRFDVSTSGTMNLGDTLTTGSELRAVDGYKLRDGDIVSIDGINFEFEMGSTIVFPSGAAAIGQSFTVGGQTFTFAAVAGGPNTIVVSATDGPGDVRALAQTVVNTVLGPGSALDGGALTPIGDTNRLTFPGQTVTAATAALTVDGAAGIAGTSRLLLVTPDMTANEVAVIIRQALADEFSAGDITNIKGTEELIWIIGHDVDANGQGPLGFADSLPGDAFSLFSTARPSVTGVSNAFEGVYVDDIILGFAERGEMATGANAALGSAFIDNPKAITQAITTGEYDVEIRRATDYAMSEKDPPTNSLARAIDTNAREAELVSITIPSSVLLKDGGTITISDGIDQVVFQFLDGKGTSTATPGAFPIVFNPAVGAINDHDAETSISLAARIRDAINSVTVQNILRVKASLSDSRDQGNLSTSSQLHLTRNAIVTVSADMAADITVTMYNGYGDQNHLRDQGQLIIQSSFISDSSQFGIVSDALIRSGQPTSPHAGSVRNLHTVNNERIVTGVVIMNNVIAANVLGGIQFSGDQGQAAFSPQGQVPYGRIVNNTIVGTGSGIGIFVEQTASPTILNNIVANFGTGISIDGASQGAGTTLGSNLYRGNGINSNAGLGAFPIVLSATDPLFVDQANRNYYLAPGSQAIDSSVTSLGDRVSILRVKQPLDLDGRDDKGSPIIAPEFDVYGQLRGNDPDVETPAGQGSSVFIDRGAIDRVDFLQPRAQLSNPEDQSLIDGDLDVDEVWIDQTQTLRQFRVRLIDEGVGIDNRNVDQTQFVLKRVLTDGVTVVTLTEGVDYQFVYNEITREAIFNAATFFADANTEVRYIILVDNNGISGADTVNGVRDLAGNYLLPNRSDGTTRFDIVLTDGENDPPENTVPLTTQTTPEDTTLVFNQANGNRISIFDRDAHLGTNVMTVTLTAVNGVLSLGSLPAGLTFAPASGDGVLDVTMTFTGRLQVLNTALNGLRFIPNADYFGPASVTVLTNDLGEFSGPPETDTDVITIDVTPVNDPPSFAPLTNPAPVQENLAELAAGITIPGFMTGQVAGPPNESPPQTISALLTVLSVTGSWSTTTFFAAGPSINTTTGDLTFRTRPDVNGTATIRVVLQDSLLAQSAAQTFVLTVNPVNDIPVYTLDPLQGNITDFENQGLKTSPFVSSFAVARATALDELRLPPAGQTATWTPVVNITSGTLAFDSIQVLPNGRIEYKTTKDKYGTADVTFTLTDNGGLPGVDTAAPVVVMFTINEVNDKPVNVVPGPQSTNEDTTLVFSGALGRQIMVGDPDIYLGNNRLMVTLTASRGVITLNGVGGLTFTTGNGVADSVMAFTGDVADINVALNGLSFIPEPDYFGPASIDVLTNDLGQFTSVGLPAETDLDRIDINIISVNDPPSFDPLATPLVSVLEDAGPVQVNSFLTGLSGGPANEVQTLTAEFTLTSITSSWLLSEFFTAAPSIVFDSLTPTGRLVFQTAPDVNGSVTYDILVRDFEGLPSGTRSFTIVVDPVNDKPMFDPVPTPPTILEDAGAQTVPSFVTNASGGPRDESQVLTSEFTVLSTTGSWLPNEFFSVLPTVNLATGQMTYTVANNVNGTATVAVLLRDSEGLPSNTQTFVVTVTAVNDAPVFNAVVNPPAVNEDAGLRTVNGFVSGQSAGPRDEPTALTSELTVFSVTGSWNTSNFFAPGGAPTVNPVTGVLTYQTAQDVNGTATIRILLRDSAGLPSAVQSFVITVNAVNDKPVFTLDPLVVPVSILEDAGLGTFSIVSAFNAARATALDELGGQTPLTWILGTPQITAGNLAFDSITMLATGELRFQTTLNTAGTASVTLQLRDSGSATAPNDNLSITATFQIIVANVNDPPTAETGNYVMDAGESLTLNASASTDPDLPFGDVLTYTWDLNGDGTFETSTGTSSTSTLTWAQLVSAGVTAPAEYNSVLRVTDTALASSTRVFTLRTRTVDYGDAPNTYGTLKASTGAAHELQGTLWLGASVDGDFDGQPNAAATGDDVDADGDDENGVVFTSLFETTSLVSLATTMNVTASLAGKLDVWLDLNRNGVFDASEHTNGGTSYSLVAGVNALSVMIPPDALLGTTYMRFRISSSGGLQPTGRIIGGEVEDYAVNVTRLPTPQTPVIIKPVDFNLADGNAPITTDLTPRIEWQNNPNNHHFTVVVRNAGGTVLFTRTNVMANQLDVTTTLATGDYTVSVTAFDRANVAAPTANYAFKVVPIAVSAPTGDIVTHRPIVSWNAVAGSKSYTVEIKSARTGVVVHTVSLNATPGFLPNYNVPTELALGGYTVRVRAVDAADLFGDWSTPSAFNVRTPTTITAPTGTLLNLRPVVTWTPIFSATNYLLVLTNVTDGEESFRVSGLTLTTWTPPSNLKIADYSVSVRGFNAAGDSSIWSAPKLFRVNQTAVATAPTGRVGTTTPTFNWPVIAGADSFELIINRGYGDMGVEFSSIIPASDSYTLTTALPLGNYTFRFREINFPKNLPGTQVSTAFSVPYTFIVAAAPVVTSLSPKADPNIDWVTLSNRPIFTWTNPLGAEKSDIWIAQVGSSAAPLRVNGIVGTSFTPAQDIGIGAYTFWVRTYSNTDNPATLTVDERIASNWSQSQQFRVVTQPVAPPVGRVTTGRPVFSWNAVPGAITYEVWLANDSKVISPIVNVSAIGALNYTPTTALPVGRYTFWVRATNGLVQHGYWSTPFQFEVATAPVLAGPPSSTLVTKPVFTWNNMSVPVGGKTAGADSYDFLLYRVDPVTFKYTALPLVTGLTSPTYTIPTDLAFGQYRAVVRAFVKGRVTTPTLRGVNPTYTEFSNAINFSVGAGPTVNSIPNSNNRTPTITWQAVQGAGKYDVFIATGTSTTALVRQNGIMGTSFTVASPLAPGVYRVWVRAVSTDGTKTSSWSTPVQWTISSTTQPIDPLASASELVFAVVPQGIPELSVTSTTVSLADFDDSDEPTAPVSATESTDDTLIAVPIPGSIELLPVTPPIVVEENSAEHTDNVLAGWDKQLWWDRSAKESETLPVSTNDSAVRTSKSSASFGILGALLTLVPKAIRRKRDE